LLRPELYGTFNSKCLHVSLMGSEFLKKKKLREPPEVTPFFVNVNWGVNFDALIFII
jgi:hypothetical protein